jgi:hypothetical protein
VIPDWFGDGYKLGLAAYVRASDDAQLQAAEELGRRAFAEQLSLLEIVELHVREALRLDEAERLIALRFLLAALVPQEMAIRGFFDATVDNQAAVRRRTAAARLSSEFAAGTDVVELIAAAVIGFGQLFDGVAVLLSPRDGQPWPPNPVITVDGPGRFEDLPPAVRDQLYRPPQGPAHQPAAGLWIYTDSEVGPFLWVQFPAPRMVSNDERILADMLAHTFGTALDRAQRASAQQLREEQFGRALESHERVGQAIGILIERYRLTPRQAFDQLRSASQHNHVKLREVAEAVVETGQDPDQAAGTIARG